MCKEHHVPGKLYLLVAGVIHRAGMAYRQDRHLTTKSGNAAAIVHATTAPQSWPTNRTWGDVKGLQQSYAVINQAFCRVILHTHGVAIAEASKIRPWYPSLRRASV